MAMKQAQAALEYIILAGVLVIVLLGILAIAKNDFISDLGIKQAESIVTRIVNAADEVYASGPGSRTFIDVGFPASAKSLTLNKTSAIMIVVANGRQYEVIDSARANLTGSVNLSKSRRITIEMLESGVVNVTG
jgi:uncharacterized protein (UPF0333 family)